MPNCFWKVVKSYCLQEHNTLNILSLSYCFFFLHSYLQLVCFKIFQMEGDLLLQLEAHNYYQGSDSSGGDIPYQCRANPPNPLFLSDRCITIRIGTPHHISPPAAKSAFPINTRPSTATVALYLFHNTFYSIVLPMIIIRETYFEFILENHQYHFRRQENIMRWRKMGNCDFADLRVFD